MSVTDNTEVFISYSSKNMDIADSVVSDFESNGIKCWYAPRDIMPGEDWVIAVTGAIKRASVFVLIFTEDSNESKQVMNEVAVAFNSEIKMVPFRLTEAEMSTEFEYYLTRVHWLDAVSDTLENNITKLRNHVEVILSGEEKKEFDAAGKKKPLVPIIVAGSVLIVLALVAVIFYAAILRSPNSYMKKGIESYYSEYSGSEDNSEASANFSKAADKGEPDAYYYGGMLNMRDMYYMAAKDYFEKGMKAGSDLARLEYGYMYETGMAGRIDPSLAKELYDEALANGCVEANYYIGQYILKGYYLNDVDAAAALDYLTKATESTNTKVSADAYFAIGDLYCTGYDGVAADTGKAIENYHKSSEVYPYYKGKANEAIAETYLSLDDDINADQFYVMALEFYEAAADAEDIESTVRAGYFYQYGLGTECDGEKAMDYYRKASDSGSTQAMCMIGDMYKSGAWNVKNDYDKAYEWYKKAADMRYAPAMIEIGEMYRQGLYGLSGGESDFSKAKEWYEEALDNGYLYAYRYLGIFYREGYEGEPDYQKAYENFYKSALAGDSEAMVNIAQMLQMGFVPKDSAELSAEDWFAKAASLGNTSAMINLGGIAEQNGNYEEAKKWYLKASSKNDYEAMKKIAELYYFAKLSANPDEEATFKWYKKAAEAGDTESLTIVGAMYYEGIGVEKNYSMARECLEKASEYYSNIPEIYYYLGVIYKNGLSTNKDFEKAAEYFSKAADLNDVRACEELGLLYYDGNGVPQDYAMALMYFQKAETNHTTSGEVYRKLGDMYYYSYGVVSDDFISRSYYLKAVDLGVNDSDVYANLGDIHYRNIDYDSAAEYYIKASEISSDSEYMYMAGVSYYSARDYQNALTWFGKSIENGYMYSSKAKEYIIQMKNDRQITEQEANKLLNF